MNTAAAVNTVKKQGKRDTKVMRLPLSVVNQVEHYISKDFYRIPRLSGRVPAGFPLAAEDHVEEWVDLNQMFIKHPDRTFIIEATGDSMIGAGIEENDLLIVDATIEPKNGMIVIAAIDGEYTVKRLSHKEGKIKLIPANDHYPEIDITQNMQFYIAGVVVKTIRSFMQ